MSQIVFHIGAPRTGTTSLQKNIFPKIKSNFLITKTPYKASIYESESLPKRISLKKCDTNTEILNVISTKARKAAFTKDEQDLIQLKETLQLLIEADNEKMSILVSSERLSMTLASLNCYSSLEKSDKEFLIFPILKSLRKVHHCRVVTCLRDPVPYLKSNYIRNIIQRNDTKERFLKPCEYIQKQCTLESNHPGTSALTPAMHSEFIKQLQQHAFVKAFGFQELLASDDVFSLMGLQGEDKYAFRDFPRENKLPFTKEQEQAIEIEITQALQQYGFYDRIMKAQMFE